MADVRQLQFQQSSQFLLLPFRNATCIQSLYWSVHIHTAPWCQVNTARRWRQIKETTLGLKSALNASKWKDILVFWFKKTWRIIFLTQVCILTMNVSNLLCILFLKKLKHKSLSAMVEHVLYISAYLWWLGSIFTSFQVAHLFLCFPHFSLPPPFSA